MRLNPYVTITCSYCFCSSHIDPDSRDAQVCRAKAGCFFGASVSAAESILDHLCAQAIDLRGLALRPLVPERWILFGYIHPLRQPPSENASALLDCVRRSVEAFRARSKENAEAVVPLWAGALSREELRL